VRWPPVVPQAGVAKAALGGKHHGQLPGSINLLL